MNETHVARTSITINTARSQVWDALTNPQLIRQYLFGTEVNTDWQVDSPIIYTGVWEGKPFEDKGKVLQVEEGKLLVSTFWSALSGLPDLPENYQTVRYELSTENGRTKLTIVQDNNASQEAAQQSEQNWKTVLQGMKKLLEG